jgi:selenide,water dikinase
VLSQLPPATYRDPNVLLGFESGDDAAIYRVSDEIALVLTVDFFPPIVDDPFQFGQIAVANALSDVYAKGGRPVTALNIAAFPRGLPPEVLAKVLEGGQSKASEAEVSIVGGHTVDDPEPKYGLAVTGLIRPGEQVANSGAKPGDVLVLTKAIGTGIITTAGKAGTADEAVLASAVESMSALNRGASEAMLEVGVNSATDVTGFGLLGHLNTMLSASGVSASVSRGAVPVLPGAEELLERGIAPGGTHRNFEALARHVEWAEGVSDLDRLLLCDAQTSGGLLISVPEERLRELQDALMAHGCKFAAVIGRVETGTVGLIMVKL